MLPWYSQFFDANFMFAFEIKGRRLLLVRPPKNDPRWN